MNKIRTEKLCSVNNHCKVCPLMKRALFDLSVAFYSHLSSLQFLLISNNVIVSGVSRMTKMLLDIV